MLREGNPLLGSLWHRVGIQMYTAATRVTMTTIAGTAGALDLKIGVRSSNAVELKTCRERSLGDETTPDGDGLQVQRRESRVGGSSHRQHKHRLRRWTSLMCQVRRWPAWHPTTGWHSLRVSNSNSHSHSPSSHPLISRDSNPRPSNNHRRSTPHPTCNNRCQGRCRGTCQGKCQGRCRRRCVARRHHNPRRIRVSIICKTLLRTCTRLRRTRRRRSKTNAETTQHSVPWEAHAWEVPPPHQCMVVERWDRPRPSAVGPCEPLQLLAARCPRPHQCRDRHNSRNR
jgi:hypothetical protein